MVNSIQNRINIKTCTAFQTNFSYKFETYISFFFRTNWFNAEFFNKLKKSGEKNLQKWKFVSNKLFIFFELKIFNWSSDEKKPSETH